MREPVINYFKQKSLEFNTKKVENVNEYKHFLKFLFHKTTVQPIKPPKGIVWDWLKLNLSAEKYLSIYQNLTWSKANFSETESFKTGKRSVAKVYARVGLLGNPSDGFFGKTLSMLISNFWAQVSLFPNETEDIIFLSNSLLDPTKFSSIHGISGVVNKDGYSGALILFFAMTKIFTNYCKNNSISLKKCGFKVIYETNIPRQVGLAGSSALIIAFLKALLKFYEIDDSVIPLHVQANLALNAEKLELSISSGHQDRVIQTYGGVVYMDFRESLMKERGWGEYEKLEDNVSFEVFDGLWLAYVGQPKNSGLVHNKVRSKFENGDKEVIAAMEEFGSFAKGGLQALKNRNRKEFALLMEKNFNLRRKIYGDDVIGERSLKMIEIGKKYGFAVKFSGSGGACIGLWKGINNMQFVFN
ncbi:hypothetical protein HK099_001913 [Clydaea vesicula]|uniref:GHMP kinase N-terminal domain-containing protein n=1 Tax=Clydaea vesicula TaxID=447962 RepID=A0AAD5XZ90_9FUNG|nr:hypothetical protein HK099_001913 [Clydaea vesicula]